MGQNSPFLLQLLCLPVFHRLFRSHCPFPQNPSGRESAVKDYLHFLSGGSSKPPIELLQAAGVDMTSPAPVNQALELFDTLLDEMEALMEE